MAYAEVAEVIALARMCVDREYGAGTFDDMETRAFSAGAPPNNIWDKICCSEIAKAKSALADVRSVLAATPCATIARLTGELAARVEEVERLRGAANDLMLLKRLVRRQRGVFNNPESGFDDYLEACRNSESAFDPDVIAARAALGEQPK